MVCLGERQVSPLDFLTWMPTRIKMSLGRGTLMEYLENPEKYIPEEKWSLRALRRQRERANLIVYLKKATKE